MPVKMPTLRLSDAPQRYIPASPKLLEVAGWRLRATSDLGAVLALIALVLIFEWDLVARGTLIGIDAATFFYPMYSFLGDQLRGGNLPVWNPHQLSGAPFLADPQSGWMYLPVMLLFLLLPLAAAAKSLMVFNILMAALSMYALARVLRMNIVGAFTAAIAYSMSGFMQERNACCAIFTGVGAWLPVVILCSELGIKARGRIPRLVCWALAGLALSQIMALWLGQALTTP